MMFTGSLDDSISCGLPRRSSAAAAGAKEPAAMQQGMWRRGRPLLHQERAVCVDHDGPPFGAS
ncbi:hypothetical protein ACP4OV_009353 [Aristida adscensionis]